MRPLTAIARDLVGTGEQLVVVVDQFEEVFTSVSDAAVRSEFIESLVGALATIGKSTM